MNFRFQLCIIFFLSDILKTVITPELSYNVSLCNYYFLQGGGLAKSEQRGSHDPPLSDSSNIFA